LRIPGIRKTGQACQETGFSGRESLAPKL